MGEVMNDVSILGWGGANPPLPFLPSFASSRFRGRSSPLPSPLHLPFSPVLPPLPSLTSRPLEYSYEVWGSAISWGGALAEIEFGAFYL